MDGRTEGRREGRGREGRAMAQFGFANPAILSSVS